MLTKPKFLAVAAVPVLVGLAWTAAAAPGDPAGAPAERHGGWGHTDGAAHHKEACTRGYALHAARLAYVEAALDLSDGQRPAYAKWRQSVLDGATKEKAACLEAAPPKPEAPPTVLDRQARAEKMLTLKLQSLQGSHAALQAFYEVLNPAQRLVLDHMGRGAGPRAGHGGQGGAWRRPGGDGPRDHP